MNISCILPTGLRLAPTLSAQSATVGRFTLAGWSDFLMGQHGFDGA